MNSCKSHLPTCCSQYLAQNELVSHSNPYASIPSSTALAHPLDKTTQSGNSYHLPITSSDNESYTRDPTQSPSLISVDRPTMPSSGNSRSAESEVTLFRFRWFTADPELRAPSSLLDGRGILKAKCLERYFCPRMYAGLTTDAEIMI